ncbi:hypothetical protein BST61_g3703 [Cercospora zeina]
MLSSTVSCSLLTILTMTSSVTSQTLSSSPSFVLYPYITAGNIDGPYTNQAIDRSQPLATSSGFKSDQCGYRRWSINATNADPHCNTAITVNGGFSSMLISGSNDVDELGRRNVGWSQDDCDTEAGTPGFSIDDLGEQGILHLRYDNPADQADEFGTFFTCWVDGDLYGPRLFYRNAAGTTPGGCAELLLVPRCAADTPYVSAPLTSQCYQGGLPA